MSGVNKVILVGRLGKDPELRSTKTGKQVCNMSIATSDVWVKDGNKEEKTEWHKVIVWDKTAENAAKFLKKGSQVYFEGKLQTSKYEKDGQTHYSTEILASNMQFLDSAGGGSKEDNDPSPQYPSHPDLPF